MPPFAGPISAFLRSRANLIPPFILMALVALSVYALWQRGNHLSDARDLWRTTAQTQADATRTAMAAAAIRAETARLETERRYAAHARKADHETPPAVVDLRNAADRYADAHQLQHQPKTDCRLPGGTAASAKAGPPSDRDRPGADAVAKSEAVETATVDTIAIPRAHFDQLRDNTLRLERVRIWGEGLIADGLAEADP